MIADPLTVQDYLEKFCARNSIDSSVLAKIWDGNFNSGPNDGFSNGNTTGTDFTAELEGLAGQFTPTQPLNPQGNISNQSGPSQTPPFNNNFTPSLPTNPNPFSPVSSPGNFGVSFDQRINEIRNRGA